jgi:hypothetical protein
MSVTLHAVEGAAGFSAKPTRFEPGNNSTTATVTVPRGADAQKPVTLVFRATGRMPDGTEAITESRVRFLPSATASK